MVFTGRKKITCSYLLIPLRFNPVGCVVQSGSREIEIYKDLGTAVYSYMKEEKECSGISGLDNNDS